jgi:hypothetical protein
MDTVTTIYTIAWTPTEYVYIVDIKVIYHDDVLLVYASCGSITQNLNYLKLSV